MSAGLCCLPDAVAVLPVAVGGVALCVVLRPVVDAVAAGVVVVGLEEPQFEELGLEGGADADLAEHSGRDLAGAVVVAGGEREDLEPFPAVAAEANLEKFRVVDEAVVEA